MVGSSRSQSSVEGSTPTTRDNLAVTVDKMKEDFQTFQDITLELKLAIQLKEEGPWPGFLHLTEELLKNTLEALKDPYHNLILRAETKAREIEQTAELED